ncbi:hypothetical protein LF41_2402 [Lysobacter dokdonensis DS-58]|uniref:Uncharacterized protein n=1 Tax=Lysobacter dokdonensis DS-58 TaxID=1300345 RepID=A0A0A2WNM4_9GAMM|nr:hypothetical protein LF41_2402 [Lysobacter dokdonensis DS-58]
MRMPTHTRAFRALAERWLPRFAVCNKTHNMAEILPMHFCQ